MKTDNQKIENVFQVSRDIFTSKVWGMPLHYQKIWFWLLGNALFSDYRNLKRGQIRTSIQETKEAVKWKVGYRTERLTDKQIRGVYGWMKNEGMISTTKVTKGIIITICNYDRYQFPCDSRGNHDGKHLASTAVEIRANQKDNTGNNTGVLDKTVQNTGLLKTKNRSSLKAFCNGNTSNDAADPDSAKILYDIYCQTNRLLPQPKSFTEEHRQKSLRLLTHYADDLEDFLDRFKYAIELCKFPNYLEQIGDGTSQGRINFDWLIENNTNFVNLYEGKIND